MAGHVATNISAASIVIIPRTRQSMPNSEALTPVSGKSHSKEALRARPVWTVYSIARAKYMAPPTSQPTTPIGMLGVQAGRQVKMPKTKIRGHIGMTRRSPGSRTPEAEEVPPTSADGEHDIRNPHPQEGAEACVKGCIRVGASRPKVEPMVLLSDHLRSQGPAH